MKFLCYFLTFVFIGFGLLFFGLMYSRPEHTFLCLVAVLVSFSCSYSCAYMFDNWDS